MTAVVRSLFACASTVVLAFLLGPGSAVAAGSSKAVVDWSGLRLAEGSRLDPGLLKGSPVIVVFWATWCGFCERHNARVDRLHRALGGQPQQVLGVAIDGNAESVGRFVRAKGWTFPVAVDDGSIRRQFTARRMVPMTCLVDAAGTIGQCIPGEMSDDDVMSLARQTRP